MQFGSNYWNRTISLLNRLQISINKSNLTKLLINKYNSFRSIKLEDKQID